MSKPEFCCEVQASHSPLPFRARECVVTQGCQHEKYNTDTRKPVARCKNSFLGIYGSPHSRGIGYRITVYQRNESEWCGNTERTLMYVTLFQTSFLLQILLHGAEPDFHSYRKVCFTEQSLSFILIAKFASRSRA
jgi:hypothetical protein